MKILGFGASSSRNSINKALATHATTRLATEFVVGADVEVLDLLDFEMPIFSVDRERIDGIHAHAQRFFDQLGAADALVISFAEHNGSYTAAYKNVFDWVSRIDKKVFQGKPLLALSTSPGKRGGASVLEAVRGAAPRFGAELVGSLSVPSFRDNFDADAGALTNAELSGELGRLLRALADAVNVGRS